MEETIRRLRVKVKVGSKVYDGEDTPVMVIFNKEDKQNLKGGVPSRYCSYPDVMSTEDAETFMRVGVPHNVLDSSDASAIVVVGK